MTTEQIHRLDCALGDYRGACDMARVAQRASEPSFETALRARDAIAECQERFMAACRLVLQEAAQA